MADLQARLQAVVGDAHRLERELGGGGMSRLFLATEASLGRQVVIKVLPPEFSSEVSAARFQQEIALAAHLQHPNILPVFSAGAKDDLLFYIMPFVSGESLRHRLTREGKLPAADAVRILHEVADALAYAHAEGVIHRDIKPENILLEGGHAILMDFGVARALAESRSGGRLTDTGLALGTPGYMSPEQAAGERNLDARADVYALAVVGYEMFAGQPPFTGPTPQAMIAAHLAATPKPLRDLRPETPPAVANAIARALAKDPSARLRAAAEFRDALGDVRGAGAAGPRSTRWPFVAAGALLSLGAAVALFLRGGGGSSVDPNVVAIAPFRVAGADPSFRYLREGMLDLLAAKLTGEGGQRATDPRTVLSAWRQRAGSEEADLSQDAAVELARRVGAGTLLLGAVVGTPTHLVLNASLLSTVTRRPGAQTSIEGPPDSLPAMIDRLAARLLALTAGKTEQHLADLTTTSLPALRAFLEGESEYRRGRYEEAAGLLEQAVRTDSSFALAALTLRVAAEWTTGASERQIGFGGRVAWAHRDRLSSRDLAYLVGYAGPRYPTPQTAAERLAGWQHALDLAPDRPETWYELGDVYYHEGAALAIADAAQLATAAFERSLALDSSFAPPLEHLLDLALRAANTTTVRRLIGVYTRRHPSADVADAYRWRSSALLGDSIASAALQARAEQMTTQSLWRVLGYAQLNGVGLTDAEVAAVALLRRVGPLTERGLTLSMIHDFALNRGRPSAAGRMLDQLEREPLWRRDAIRARVTDALYWDGDPGAGADAAQRLEAAASAPLAPRASDRVEQYADICLAEQWRIAHEQFDKTEGALGRLRSAAASQDTVGTSNTACGVLLTAMLAQARQRPDAHVAVARLDSLLRTGPPRRDKPTARFYVYGLARLYEAAGNREGALAAVRRRLYAWGAEGTSGLSTQLLTEARLAALTGYREGAIRAYRHYLALRSDPEPSLKPEVERVRMELARLSPDQRP